jgi:hexosaminidase
MRYTTVCIFIICFGFAGINAQPLPLIPKPAKMVAGAGRFVLAPDTKIILKTHLVEAQKAVDYFLEIINRSTGLNISCAPSAKAPIVVEIDAEITHPEAYYLNVAMQGISIKAGTATGIFYAFQTLRQLLPPEVESKTVVANKVWSIPAIEIHDVPRFPYRGLMLDVARHFFSVDFIKRYIDLMSMYKYNRLHLHLADDQGWRMEIHSYPELQNTGAWRSETLVGHLNDRPKKFDGVRYGGYYRQSELRELVRYAADRHITVIPEIDIPGHASAILTAYPELACIDGKFEVAKEWGVHNNILCPKEETFLFLERVLDEIMNVFPSKYIHIGGDECVREQWQKSEYCQHLKLQEGLNSDEQLQTWFIRRVANSVKSRGRKIIGWDDIRDGGEVPEATIMSWRGEQGGVAAAQKDYDVIMTPHAFCYFDYYQWRNRNEEPLSIGGYIPMSKVYMYDPIPKELSEKQAQHILGTQGNLWTEYIAGEQHAEYMAYPRACALSETAWTPENLKSYDDFLHRLREHSKRMEILNIHFARHFLPTK